MIVEIVAFFISPVLVFRKIYSIFVFIFIRNYVTYSLHTR